MVYKWLNNTLSGLSPSYCLLCDASVPTGHGPLCQACEDDLPVYPNSCPQCGRPLPAAIQSACGQCLKNPPSYDRTIATFAYAEPVRQLVAQLKFQHKLAVSALFAELLYQKIKQRDFRPQAILPVPLHYRRVWRRGFNQAVEIARPIARRLQIPLLLNQVIRQKHTREQTSLSSKQRKVNLANAFSLNQALGYSSIAIVDDVMTTGSTAEALASMLKKVGVDYVEVWCIARARQVQPAK